jgi:hypothetical protein
LSVSNGEKLGNRPHFIWVGITEALDLLPALGNTTHSGVRGQGIGTAKAKKIGNLMPTKIIAILY